MSGMQGIEHMSRKDLTKVIVFLGGGFNSVKLFRTVIPVKISLKQTPNWNPTSHRRRTFAEALGEPMSHTM